MEGEFPIPERHLTALVPGPQTTEPEPLPEPAPEPITDSGAAASHPSTRRAALAAPLYGCDDDVMLMLMSVNCS